MPYYRSKPVRAYKICNRYDYENFLRHEPDVDYVEFSETPNVGDSLIFCGDPYDYLLPVYLVRHPGDDFFEVKNDEIFEDNFERLAS